MKSNNEVNGKVEKNKTNKTSKKKKLLDDVVAHLQNNLSSPEEQGGFRCGLCLKDELTHKPLKKTYKFLGLKSGDTETTPDGGEVDLPRIATVNVCQKCAAKVHLSGEQGQSIIELRGDSDNEQEVREYEEHHRKQARKRKELEIQPLNKDRLRILRTGISTIRAVAMAQKEIEAERLRRLPKGVSVLKAGKAKRDNQ